MANVTREDGTLFAGRSAFDLQKINGVKVGIMGLVASRNPDGNPSEERSRLGIPRSIAVAKQLAAKLRPEVDLLVALTHIGLWSG